MDEIWHFAERAVSYLGAAGRARNHNRREQYLELAVCCLEAAARRAHTLVGNGADGVDAEQMFEARAANQAGKSPSTGAC